MNQRFLNIINHYKRYKHNNPDTWIEYCAQQVTLLEAIEKAASCINAEDKKHRHQYRLKKADLEAFASSLKGGIATIEACNNFNDLINTVRSLKAYGIGELTVYDVSVRIGAFMNVWPQYIYLHAGAKIGALGLIVDFEGDIIAKEMLPDEFSTSDLTCYELEDIMCIYKKMFLRRR